MPDSDANYVKNRTDMNSDVDRDNKIYMKSKQNALNHRNDGAMSRQGEVEAISEEENARQEGFKNHAAAKKHGTTHAAANAEHAKIAAARRK
jgi:hypothetical protein